MQALLQTLLYFIPAALVLFACYLMITRHLENDQKLKMLEFRKSINKDTLPLKLQAYERLIVFLERINPSSLLLRLNQPGLAAPQLYHDILTSIRAEYDHNVSQQLYVSPEAWNVVKKAKDDVTHVINIAMQNVGDNRSGAELGRLILELMIKHNNVPTERALEYLRQEGKLLM